MKLIKKPLLISALIPLALAPTITIACSQNQHQVEDQILDATLKKINNWFNQYLFLSLQYYLPTQAQFFSTYLPDEQLINGFTMTNINWNFQDDDRNGQKTIQFDLVKNSQIHYQNQQIIIKGFLTTDQFKVQTNQPQLNWTKQLINYQNQSASWIKTGVGILSHPWLENFSLDDLLNDVQQNDLKTIINRLITKQSFKINQIEQFSYQGIATNALIVSLSLTNNQTVGNPLKILITNLKPDPQPQLKINEQLNSWKQALINNDLIVFNPKDFQNLTMSQFLADLERQLDSANLLQLNNFPIAKSSTYDHQVRLGTLQAIATDWDHLSVEIEGDIYYHLQNQLPTQAFVQRYSQPIRFRLFFRF